MKKTVTEVRGVSISSIFGDGVNKIVGNGLLDKLGECLTVLNATVLAPCSRKISVRIIWVTIIEDGSHQNMISAVALRMEMKTEQEENGVWKVIHTFAESYATNRAISVDVGDTTSPIFESFFLFPVEILSLYIQMPGVFP